MPNKGRGKKSATAGSGDQTRRLKDIAAIDPQMTKALQALDIVHADQLTAAARIPSLHGELVRHLGVTDQQLANAVEAAREAVAETAAAAPAVQPGGAPQAPVAVTRPRSFGALPPPPRVRAAALSIPLSSTGAKRAKLPSSTNLVSKMSPIRDQGGRGTCVAFSLTAIHEYETRAKKDDLSEQYLYYKAKAVDGRPADCGTTQSAASSVLASSGQCTEAIWGYRGNTSCNDHGPVPNKANADAAKHQLTLDELNPHDVVAMKTALAGGRPVGISIPVFLSWYQSPTTERTGRITMPIGNEQAVDGHCMCIVGYRDDGPSTVTPTPGGGFFILRNSWGTTWGPDCEFGAGYGTIPYGYIVAYSWESFALAHAPTHKKTRRRRKAKKHAKSAASAPAHRSSSPTRSRARRK
jgi:papain like protease